MSDGARAAAVREPRPPYVGLVPLTEEDAPFFFGRAREQTIVITNLRATRLTLLYGPSGVGKSSLLQAGVVPRLRELAMEQDAKRRVSGQAPFAIAAFRTWHDPPLAGLMETVRVSVAEAPGAQSPQPWRPGMDVVETLRAWTLLARTLLIVLDQFEDYFLHHVNEDSTETLAGELPRIVNARDLRVNVLIAIREDALAKLDRFKGPLPQLFTNYLRIGPLDRGGALRAINGPIEQLNERLPPGATPYSIEPALADAVLDATRVGQMALVRGAAGP
jgi:Novel STAND NTPase 1